jgi:hypothetical protein
VWRNEREGLCQMDVEAGAALKQGLGAVKIQKSSQTRAPKEPASIDRDKPTEKDSSYVAILNGLSSLSSSSRRLVDSSIFHTIGKARTTTTGGAKLTHVRACFLPKARQQVLSLLLPRGKEGTQKRCTYSLSYCTRVVYTRLFGSWHISIALPSRLYFSPSP